MNCFQEFFLIISLEGSALCFGFELRRAAPENDTITAMQFYCLENAQHVVLEGRIKASTVTSAQIALKEILPCSSSTCYQCIDIEWKPTLMRVQSASLIDSPPPFCLAQTSLGRCSFDFELYTPMDRLPMERWMKVCCFRFLLAQDNARACRSDSGWSSEEIRRSPTWPGAAVSSLALLSYWRSWKRHSRKLSGLARWFVLSSTSDAFCWLLRASSLCKLLGLRSFVEMLASTARSQ